MAGLHWMVVILAVFLSAENSLSIDPDRLSGYVRGIKGQYGVQGMFSVAVRIPENQNQNQNAILRQVYSSDPGTNVKNTMNNNQVYAGSRVVAAKVLKQPNRGTDHAESRVVDNLNYLFSNDGWNDLLLFYVYSSPCVEKCSSDTHRESILRRINVINRWNNRAVVFSTIFKPRVGPGNTDDERRAALLRLGAVVGLGNIFRCDGNQCTSCSVSGQVAHYCVSDE
ncbi:uncharacterized protein LOC127355052 [Dicentrarchus labrax]|uniref:uncharacterized protein LOC127355052 n=1 Tax=Dicentrarchus labrax TaxID=13489 RepID=UPI0021F637CD|nr:uncharacterized protein LOC127355052 [Dicentrarchus labrax]